jgi:hypothetical protein
MPIYRLDLTAAAWRLLWWLISNMDEKQEVHGGWRARAAREMGKDRIWIGHCAEQLNAAGLIQAEPRKRFARVVVQAIRG